MTNLRAIKRAKVIEVSSMTWDDILPSDQRRIRQTYLRIKAQIKKKPFKALAKYKPIPGEWIIE